jgi:hypothetical protein
VLQKVVAAGLLEEQRAYSKKTRETRTGFLLRFVLRGLATR